MRVFVEKCNVKGRQDRIEGDYKLGKAIWSPTQGKKGADIYKLMREVNPGDLIIHLTDNKGIRGISEVAEKYSEGIGIENTKWAGVKAYFIKLRNYHELDPFFSRDDFLNQKYEEVLNEVKERSNVFYDKKLQFNQGAYLTESPYQLTEHLNECYETTHDKRIQILDNYLKENFRQSIFDSLRKKIEGAGFIFEKEQIPHHQKRKEKELKFAHPKLIARFHESNIKVNAKKFYLKPLSDGADCEIGFTTGKSSPLFEDDLFVRPNIIDEKDESPAWSNNENDNRLDKFLSSIKSFLNKKENINYWVFQGSPKVHDWENSLKENKLTEFAVNAHVKNIKIGDRVIIWISGNKSGCYALAEVISNSKNEGSSINEAFKAGIQVTHNLVKNPILKEKIEITKKLKDLKVGHQGTNFSATQDQFEALIEIIENSNSKRYWLYAPGENADRWDEFYSQGIMGLGWSELGDLNQFSDKREISEKLQELEKTTSSKKNDANANYEFKESIEIGDVIIVKKGRGELLGYGIVTSEYHFDGQRTDYNSLRKVDWKLKGNWKTDHSLALKTLTNITNYPSEHKYYKSYSERLLANMSDEYLSENKNDHMEDFHKSLNTILYGPPGTGKTYHTILRAAEIIENRKIDNYEEALNIFKSNLHDRIEFITFHQNYSYEDFIQGLRPETDNKSSLVFEKKDGVFKKIADKALENLRLSKKDITELSKDVQFDRALEKFKETILEAEENYSINQTAYIFEVEEDAFRYTGEKWANHTNGLRMKFNDLQEFYRQGVTSRKDIKKMTSISGLANQHATYYYLVYEKILSYLTDDVEVPTSVEKKNYVIIIDEINRANISRVFGELITLIEPDKRSNGALPLEAKLPSGDPFTVPSNLFILGTMNTADKSIALLDIALRRRFEFEAMFPLYHIPGKEIYNSEVLKKINEQVIVTKGHDFQIGHSYFMESKDLTSVMNKKVIPLLLEYYMNDQKEVEGILHKAGLELDKNAWPLRITAKRD